MSNEAKDFIGEEKVREIVVAAGGPKALSSLLEITPQAINEWYLAGVIPYRRAHAVAKMTGGKFSAHDVNPTFPKKL